MKKFPLFQTVNYLAEFANLETKFQSKDWTQKRQDKFDEDKRKLKQRCFDAVCALRKGIQTYIDDEVGTANCNHAVSSLHDNEYSFIIYTEEEKGYPLFEVFVGNDGLVQCQYYLCGGFPTNACHQRVWMKDRYTEAYSIEGETFGLSAEEVCGVVEKTAKCFKQWFQLKSTQISNPVYEITPVPSAPPGRTLVYSFSSNSYVAGSYARSA